MTPNRLEAARTEGRLIGTLSGFLFAFTLGLMLWLRLGAWNGSKWAVLIFLVADASIVSLSSWFGGWIAPRLLPPASEGDATGFGLFAGLVLDLYFCFLFQILDGPNRLAHLNWDQVLTLLGDTIQTAVCGSFLAAGWGAATALSIWKALQLKKPSNSGESLES